MATSKMVMTADYAQWPKDGTPFAGDRQRELITAIKNGLG
jgi:hypothetical protein